jgi:hypothetical protein
LKRAEEPRVVRGDRECHGMYGSSPTTPPSRHPGRN